MPPHSCEGQRQARLEAEACRLSFALRSHETELERVTEELSAVQASTNREVATSAKAEALGCELREELATVTAWPEGQRIPDSKHWIQEASYGAGTLPLPMQATSSSPNAGGARQPDATMRMSELVQEIRDRELELQRLCQDRVGNEDALEAAEAVASLARSETGQLQVALEASEKVGQQLLAQNNKVLGEEAILHKWIAGIGGELAAAHAKQANLFGTLAESQSCHIQFEETRRQPLFCQADLTTLRNLEQCKRGCLALKAELVQEVAAERLQRHRFTTEVLRCRAEMATLEQHREHAEAEETYEQHLFHTPARLRCVACLSKILTSPSPPDLGRGETMRVKTQK